MLTDKHRDAEHWAKVHIQSDRSKPVALPETRRSSGHVFFMWRKKKESAE